MLPVGTLSPRPAETPPTDATLSRVRVVVAIIGVEMVVPIIVTAAIALALIPVPRFLAWPVLLLLPAGFGRYLGCSPGTVSAATAALLYMLTFAPPRFATIITDQPTIRAGFMLGIIGVIVAAVADWHRRRTHGDFEVTDPS